VNTSGTITCGKVIPQGFQTNSRFPLSSKGLLTGQAGSLSTGIITCALNRILLPISSPAPMVFLFTVTPQSAGRHPACLRRVMKEKKYCSASVQVKSCGMPQSQYPLLLP
jgi:hypothetical protein